MSKENSGRAAAKSAARYVQAVPIYLSSDTNVRKYFVERRAEVDAISGPNLIFVVPTEVEHDDPHGLISGINGDVRGEIRFPGLKLQDLPCLWIEDDVGGSAIVELPTEYSEIVQLLRVMADACVKTKGAVEIREITLREYGQQVKNRPSVSKVMLGELPVTKATERLIALGCGVVFVAFILLIALFVPTPSDFQYTVFRIVLALAAAGFVSMTPGFIEWRIANGLRAGGALAVFVIVYFYSPAALVSHAH